MSVSSTVLLALVCAWAAVSCSPPTTPAPKVLTRYRLKNAYYTMHLLETEKHLSIAEQLQSFTNETTLQDRWVQLMVQAGSQSGIDRKTALEQFCHDGYGNLFNVDFKTNLVAHKASPQLTDMDFAVLIWSSGQNGTNEFGNGDDVVFPRQPRKRSAHL